MKLIKETDQYSKETYIVRPGNLYNASSKVKKCVKETYIMRQETYIMCQGNQ